MKMTIDDCTVDEHIIGRDMSHAIPWLHNCVDSGNWNLILAQETQEEVRYIIKHNKSLALMIYDLEGNGYGRAHFRVYSRWMPSKGEFFNDEIFKEIFGEDRDRAFSN